MSVAPIKGKLINSLLAVTILFVILGGVTLAIINNKLREFDEASLKNIANEKYTIVNKELASINRTFRFFSSLIQLGEIDLYNKIIAERDYRDFVAGYVFVDIKNLKTHNFFKGKYRVREIGDISDLEVLDFRTETSYDDFKNDSLFAIWQPIDSAAYIRFILNVEKLNERFWNEEIGQSAYVEIYDSDFQYIIGVDSAKVGKKFPLLHEQFGDNKGKVVLSDYLNLDVLQYPFKMGDNMRNHTMLVSVPILKGDEVLSEVSLPLWGLWLIGLLAIFSFLIFIIRQDRKQYNLQMRNLQFQHEKAILEYSNLKEKMNPHFLFNSLGSLQQLIQKQPDVAKTYIVKLSKFYRKLLNLSPNGISTLQEELDVLREYIFLQQLRFGDQKLPISYTIDSAVLGQHLPTLSLQILVENVIKHNVLSNETPVNIEVITTSTGVYVSNLKNLRQDSINSERYGTNFLMKTYEHYGINSFRIEENDVIYRVFLPFVESI